MKKILFFFLLLLSSFPLPSNPITLKDKFLSSKAGEYIVTSQNKITSLLSIRKKTENRLLLEEISIPETSTKTHPIHSWKEWVEKGALGHSLWMIYEINLDNAQILSIYSPSEKKHYQVAGDEIFFAKLLTLPLEKIPLQERRKIGPPPLSNEPDTREIWSPTLTIEGKKSPSTFTVYRTTFPQDKSELSGKEVDLYFADKDFAFPIFMQVQTGHYTVMLHTIDSGSNLHSEAVFLPSILPSFEKTIQKTDSEILLTLIHLNEEDFQKKENLLYALDITNPQEKHFYRIPFSESQEKDKVTLHISNEKAKSLLEKNHRYLWVFHPQAFPDLFIEHPEIFVF